MPYLTDMFHDQNGRVPTPDGNTSRRPTDGFDTTSVADRLRSRVIGQDNAIDAVVRALVLARAGAHDPDRPLANLLLVGPTGVGKTELVRRVAAHLRSGPDDLCRIDMNSLAQEHYAASFSGAPPGYAGSKEGHSLFDRTTVEGDPYTPGVVLFDEVEKAHPTVLRALLQVLDSGRLRLANGQQTISFRNAFVFLTSNLGSTELAHRRGASWRRVLDRLRLNRLAGRGANAVVDRALRTFFDPEFLNRIDETVVFTELDRAACERITKLEIELLGSRLSRRGVELTVDEQVTRILAVRGFDPVYGARGLRRVLRTALAGPVADEVVRVRPQGTEQLSVAVSAVNGTIRAQAVQRPNG